MSHPVISLEFALGSIDLKIIFFFLTCQSVSNCFTLRCEVLLYSEVQNLCDRQLLKRESCISVLGNAEKPSALTKLGKGMIKTCTT